MAKESVRTQNDTQSSRPARPAVPDQTAHPLPARQQNWGNQALQRQLRAQGSPPATQQSGGLIMRHPAEQAPEEQQALAPSQPEQSAQIPLWAAALAGGGGGDLLASLGLGAAALGEQPAGEEQALVGLAGATATRALDDPEGAAQHEAPYATGMSDGQLASSLSAGQPLADDVRASMERRYSQPLDHVRVHTDDRAAGLCDRFAARAFAFRNHIAFGSGAYTPGTDQGQRLIRHELSHVMQPPPAAASIQRAAVCSGTCSPGTAPPFSVISDPSFNCYAYAMNSSASGFLQPGQIANTTEFRAAIRSDPAAIAAVGGPAAALNYFTPAGVLRNATADLGAPLSTNCNNCCASGKRKVIAVTTDSITSVGAASWDHHWYRKDADSGWSHKRGATDSQRADASGVDPICNPCNANRNYGSLNYRNVVGSWCV